MKNENSRPTHITLTPWALEEPSEPLAHDLEERKLLFDDSPLGLLYSGSFGRAHEYELTLKLARLLGDKEAFAYSARGSRLDELKKAITPKESNIRFAEFAPPERLSARLSAPDIHIVSLRPQWTGTVVPSKFFGALAAGRPVLFEGEPESGIAYWIREYKVGWNLQADNIKAISQELIRFGSDPAANTTMFKHCHRVYRDHFSKRTVIDRWAKTLSGL